LQSDRLKDNGYLQSEISQGKERMKNKTVNWSLLIIGGFVLIIACVIAFFILASGEAIFKTNTVNKNQVDRSQISDIYADQIINGYNQNGVRIHATFKVDNRSGVLCVILVFFFDEYGNPIKGYNGSTIQKNGQIAIGQDFTPNLESVEASKLFFMPIEELHLENGSSTIKYQIEIYEVSSGALITKSDLYSFTISQ